MSQIIPKCEFRKATPLSNRYRNPSSAGVTYSLRRKGPSPVGNVLFTACPQPACQCLSVSRFLPSPSTPNDPNPKTASEINKQTHKSKRRFYPFTSHSGLLAATPQSTQGPSEGGGCLNQRHISSQKKKNRSTCEGAHGTLENLSATSGRLA